MPAIAGISGQACAGRRRGSYAGLVERDLLVDLVAAVSIALGGGWLATRVGLSPIAGYVAAGVAISPFTPGFVGDLERLRLIADIGVVLLLFGIGVEFSASALRATGWRTAASATAMTAVVLGVATGAALLLGWGADAAMFTGAAVAISSSTVIAKLLAERGDAASVHGRVALASSIVQDVLAVVLVSVLIAVSGEGGAPENILLSIVKAGVLVGSMLVVGTRAVPPLLDYLAEHEARELFVLSIAAIALGAALVSEWAGLSLAFGAFLAGLVVSESDASHRVLGELLPARDVFGVLFFVSVGMLIDPSVVGENPVAVVVLVALIVVVKGTVAALLIRASGASPEESRMSGALLANAGEFSFVLIGVALDRGVVDNEVFSVVVAATAVSIVAAPVVVALVGRAGEPQAMSTGGEGVARRAHFIRRS